jgi:hypothetical protein
MISTAQAGRRAFSALPPQASAAARVRMGTEALAAGEHGVAHGLVNRTGALGITGEKGVQRIIDEGLLAFKIVFEVGHGLVLGGELTKAKL